MHERFMRAALRLALKGAGLTSPNPAVGAVLVKDDRIISKGYHRKAGLPHAEAEALIASREAVSGSTLYVTLEPCCHWGRTPPCTDAVIRAGIRKVVIGIKDPNPKVAGKGIRALRSAGIDVVCGVLESECREINAAYIKYITRKLPFVTLKLASSLDGRIATPKGESKWITGRESRAFVHRLRSLSDAVMVGSGTVLKDDPLLTVRSARGKNPRRVVLDSSFRIPLDAKVLRREDPDKGPPIIFTTGAASRAKIEKAIKTGVQVIITSAAGQGVDIKRVLKELGKLGITSLFVEGGGRVAASLLKAKAVDGLVLFLSPVFLGADSVPSIGPLELKALKASPKLKKISTRSIGDDIIIEGSFS